MHAWCKNVWLIVNARPVVLTNSYWMKSPLVCIISWMRCLPDRGSIFSFVCVKVDRLQVVNCDDALEKKKISKDTILSDAFPLYNDDHLENLHLIRRHKFPDALSSSNPIFTFNTWKLA